MREETIKAVLESKGIHNDQLSGALKLLFDQQEFKDEIYNYVVDKQKQKQRIDNMARGKII